MEELLLQILSDHLAGRKTHLSHDADVPALARLAKAQQVEAIVYAQCPRLPAPSLHTAYNAAAFYYANRSVAVQQVQDAFDRNGIPFFFVKGFRVARFYPAPCLRTMGDCDLIVFDGYMEKAIGVMEDLGFSGRLATPHEWIGLKQWMCFEIHDRLVAEDEHTPAKQRTFFNACTPYLNDGVPDDSFHFLYMIEHIRKHFIHSGAGIRLFFDLAVVMQNAPSLRWEWIAEKLDEIELSGFAGAVFSLIESWFGVRAPIPFEKLDPAFEKEVREKVFKDGVFGKNNAENERNYMRDVFRRGKGPLFIQRLLFFFCNLFPSYQSMKTYPGISYLAGRPYLLPAAYLHRFFLLLSRRDKKQTRETIRAGLMPKSELAARRRFLEQMGLGDQES